MGTLTRNWLMAATLGLLVACGGGGGGDRAAGVEPGPPPSTPVPPPPPIVPAPNPSPYAEAQELLATITGVTVSDNGVAVVEFQLTDGEGTAIIDLQGRNVRFTIAKLQSSPLGNLTGSWQSYINRVAQPAVGTGTEPNLQANYEREEDGFVNNEDGTYSYTFTQSITSLPEDVLSQAETEGLDLSYDPDLTHRVSMQFDGNDNTTANPFYDWVPATGATSGIFNMDIAATANCNNCHDPLAFHGSNRREIQYCVTCHNPGSTDPDSTNTVDFKVMVHKIHAGANLPSVQAGGQYVIYGYRNREHDYSNLRYPQDIRNCVNCHAGTATGAGREDLTLTSQGDNWAEYASTASCGSCHDGVSDDGFDAPAHMAGKEDTDCASCHSAGGLAGSIADSHRILAQEARQAIAGEIIDISNTAPGEVPEVTFRVYNPLTEENYDILADPIWQDSRSRLRVRLSWDTRDYHNTGNGEDDASSVALDALDDEAPAQPVGDGSFRVTSPIAIPNGSEAPFIAATGSGVAVLEGRARQELEEGEGPESISLTNVHKFFSIDEADGDAVARREIVDLEKCQSCHVTLAFHGGSRADNIDSCVTCHNPRNTINDEDTGETKPTMEGTVDMKVMIHGIHAAGMRDEPLEVRGPYTEEDVHYPGNLANCAACHDGKSYTLPLDQGVLAPTVDSGALPGDPSDDIVATPTAAICSSCHYNAVDMAHMEQVGGANFATTQQAIDDGLVVESCSVCHGEGHAFDVGQVHEPSDE
jgi:OmcA/MtrC family decaheme c-type cytochrome